jgi:hypothetical protein
MITQRILMFVISASVGLNVDAQFFLGLRSSQYGGVTDVDYNPAIADNPFIVDINLISVAAMVNNNYVGLSRDAIYHHTDFSDPNFQADYLKERINGLAKSAYVGAQIEGPLSFMFSFGRKGNKNKNAIAFTYHTNFIFNADHVTEELARIAYYGVGPKADSVTHFLGKQLNNTNLSIKSAIWNDYGITYSRVLYDKGVNMIKAGGTIKLLQPIAGAYADGTDLNYKWTEYNTLNISKSYFNYAYSEGLITSKGYSPQTIKSDLSAYLNNMLAYKYAAPSAAVDLGAVYEWRPDQEVMRCSGVDRDYTRTRYKVAVGFSIMDFGAMRFRRGEYSADFVANVQGWDVANVKFPNGIQSIDDTIHSRFQQLQTGKTYFTLWLPTRFNVFVDYNITHGLGVNGSAMISPDMSPQRDMLHQVTTFTVTPKYDILWVGAYLPLSVDVMGNVSWGATLRVGPLIVGTSDLLGLFAKKYVYNADIHAALKVTIPYMAKRNKSKSKLDKVNCFFKTS